MRRVVQIVLVHVREVVLPDLPAPLVLVLAARVRLAVLQRPLLECIVGRLLQALAQRRQLRERASRCSSARVRAAGRRGPEARCGVQKCSGPRRAGRACARPPLPGLRALASANQHELVSQRIRELRLWPCGIEATRRAPAGGCSVQHVSERCRAMRPTRTASPTATISNHEK